MLSKPVPKRGKTITTETFHLVTNVYEDDSFSKYVTEKKDYVSLSKEVHKKNFGTSKNLCNSQILYTVFKEKHPNVNIGFSKSCALSVLTGSKMTYSVCVCNAHQNVVFLVDAMDCDTKI